MSGRQRMPGAPEDRSRRWRGAGSQEHRGEEPRCDEGEGEGDPADFGTERGDDHEQHRSGHERLAAGVGLERERVAR